ncbi:hypothetical protein AnigIFM60653_011942 [Aspergillus niger]|nr:hypothetical protein AnigIFM60653_011942 [Aspergillus niger]GLA21561.1 hypothetical protein AnigIFM62618_011230 [Aspergillus niger]
MPPHTAQRREVIRDAPDANHVQPNLSAAICPTGRHREYRTPDSDKAPPPLSVYILRRASHHLRREPPGCDPDPQLLSDATAIICTVGENENIPGVTILRQCAGAIINGLSALRASAPTPTAWTPPRLLLLSSATWNPRFAANRPALLHWMIRNAFARPYSDLVQAQEMLLGVPGLVKLLLVQPSALIKEPATGCVISADFAYMAIPYEDLAEGFVQLATMPEYEKITTVGVSSAKAKNALLYVPLVLGKVIRGLPFQFVPGYWQAEYAISRRLTGIGGKSRMG